MCSRYSDTAVNLLLQTATTLDPRFKLLPYASEEDKNIISTSMKQMLIRFIEEDRGKSAGPVEESPSKKSRLSGKKCRDSHSNKWVSGPGRLAKGSVI